MAFFSDTVHRGRFFLVTYISGVCAVVLHLLNILIPAFPAMGFFGSNTVNTVGKWYDLGLLSLFVMLASVLVLQFLRHSAFYKVIGWIGLVLSGVVLVLVNSLLVWILGAGFSLMYIVLNAIMQRDTIVHDRMSYPALGILVLSVIFLLVGGKVGPLANSVFGFQFEEVRPTLSSTIEVIGDMLKIDPVFGVGVNRFEVSWLLNKPISVNTSNYWDTDFRFGYSNLLSVPVTHGVVGTIAWLLFLGTGFYYAFRLLFVPLEQKSDLFVNLYAVLGFSFFTIVMLAYVPSVVLVGLYFVFLGFFMSSLNSAGLIRFREVHIDHNPRLSFAYILGLVLLIIAFIYAGFMIASQYASRVMYDRALTEFNRTGDLQATGFAIGRAQFVYASDVYLRSLSEIGLSNVNQVLQDRSLSQEEAEAEFTSRLQIAVKYANEAIAYDPQSYANRMALSAIYKSLVPLQVSGAKDLALKVLSDTEGITPNNPSLNLERARVYSLAREYDAAMEEIRKAIELKPNFVDAVFLLSQIQVEKGETDQAVASIQSALGVAPYDPNLYFQLGLLKYNQQRYNESVKALENAVMLSPFFGNAKYFLGLSYYRNGNTGFAITQFENLVQMYPENSEVSLILSNLQVGREPLDGAQPPLDQAPEDRDELPVDENSVDSEEIVEVAE
jgi:tetratricopeptide (TPR) repeat protein